MITDLVVMVGARNAINRLLSVLSIVQRGYVSSMMGSVIERMIPVPILIEWILLSYIVVGAMGVILVLISIWMFYSRRARMRG
jgi:hypothetical protein